MCCYCGEKSETRDHVPSKVLLDDPFPENLPVVPCCLECNQNFSLDEEYFACIIECAFHGTTQIDKLGRDKIKRILSQKISLHKMLTESMTEVEGQIYFKTDEARISNVVLKLARGHAKFENSEMQWGKPVRVWIKPIEVMSQLEIDTFFSIPEQTSLPEVGSRALQRVMINSAGNIQQYWIPVQQDNYRYCISHDSDGLRVKIIIWEYLACEIIWR